MKTRKPIKLIIAAMAVTVPMVAVACGGADGNAPKTYTLTFYTDGGTELAPITAIGGSMIFAPADPTRSGYTFGGWYTAEDFGGERVSLPDIMPDRNVAYYAKFDPIAGNNTVTYEYNLGKVPHTANIHAVSVAPGTAVTVEDGNKYGAQGYKFMGWSTSPFGTVSLTETKPNEYESGASLTVDGDITLYAQWAVGYTDRRGETDDIIYVYMPLADQGRGAAILSRKDKDDLLGFVESDANTDSGEYEFTFYSEEFAETLGEYNGRLYGDLTYAVSDGYNGQFLYYDHVTGQQTAGGYVLALDGFGYAVLTEVVGSQIVVRASGDYEYDAERGDYLFEFTEDDGADAEEYYMHFKAELGEVESPDGTTTQFKGSFDICGLEEGGYIGYVDDLQNYTLVLDGYGGAVYTEYDDIYGNDPQTLKTVVGTYVGTENYENEAGEWQFIPTAAADSAYGIKFITDVASTASGQAFNIYIKYEEEKAGTFTLDEGNELESTLYLDGYGSALYTDAVNRLEYVGTVTVDGDSVVLVPQMLDNQGNPVQTNTIAFTLDRQAGTFVRAAGGLVIVGDTLTGYTGKTSIVEIPDTVTTVNANVFNYANTNVSLVSVTIPASVTSIGAHAFQNNYTLRRAIFLSSTPIDIDFSADNDPFRWGAGDFVIVVPEDYKQAYINAWTDCPYTIMGSEEVLILPEFVVEDGVLVRYNRPENEDYDGAVVLPPDVTEIADNVFLGMDYITSVDLNNVTKIGEQAFYGCSNLTTALMPHVTEVGEAAFGACYSLNGSAAADVLELPAIEDLGAYAFTACESLRTVKLGENLKSIGDQAFYECNIYDTDPPLIVELLGDTPPTMGSRVTTGNIAFRFKVKDIRFAVKCYRMPAQWNSYCRHLYIESGDEKGSYISGADILVLDGRAVYQSNYVWLYAIDGNKITFYEYNEQYREYTSIEGTIENGTIKVELLGVDRTFVLMEELMTYTTANGKDTLVCDPEDLSPENYEGYSGDADVTFNGKAAKLHIVGYNTKIIYGFDEDGTLYDIYISFDGEKLVTERRLSPVRTEYTAPDGSKITMLTSDGTVYVETASFKIAVSQDANLEWTAASGMGIIATQTSDGVYTFTFRYRTANYNFTVTVTGEGTFTYTYTRVAVE